MVSIEIVNAESISSWDSLLRDSRISSFVKFTPSVIDISSERRFSSDWSEKMNILKYWSVRTSLLFEKSSFSVDSSSSEYVLGLESRKLMDTADL